MNPPNHRHTWSLNPRGDVLPLSDIITCSWFDSKRSLRKSAPSGSLFTSLSIPTSSAKGLPAIERWLHSVWSWSSMNRTSTAIDSSSSVRVGFKTRPGIVVHESSFVDPLIEPTEDVRSWRGWRHEFTVMMINRDQLFGGWSFMRFVVYLQTSGLGFTGWKCVNAMTDEFQQTAEKHRFLGASRTCSESVCSTTR